MLFPADAESLSESERIVLDLIWRAGPISRQSIANATGLTPMTVSRVTRALADKSLVADAPERSGARGNPIRPLSINLSAGFSVGVNFTQTCVEVGLVDLGGSVLALESFRTEGVEARGLVERVLQVLDETAEGDGRFARERLVGVGFALPGDFSERGRILAAHPLFEGLRHRDLQAEFSAALGARTVINSDSNSAAVGERLLGAGRNFDTFLYVHLGHGVGGGLILEGRPYFGANLNAGIIGNHFPLDRPRPSGLDYIETLRRAGRAVEDFADLGGFDPFSAPETREWIRRAGGQLRDKLNYAVKLIDPQAVIVGGRLPSDMNHALAAEIDKPDFLITNEMDRLLPRPRVIGSLLGPRAGVVGAACLPIADMLFRPA